MQNTVGERTERDSIRRGKWVSLIKRRGSGFLTNMLDETRSDECLAENSVKKDVRSETILFIKMKCR